MNLQHPFARSLVTARNWPFVIDMGVALCGLALFFGIIRMAHYWMGTPVPVVPISHSVRALPLYAFYSIVRIGLAYLLSLIFAITYGYTAAYNPRIEPWMIAVLDILQSIPVLSFLPPVVLAMVALVPGHQLGIELGVILLIFTGQVWNLAFSFYSSLKSIPREMMEASRIYRYSAWQRFWQLEMPYAAIGLVWNSIVSVAGGWFALMLCEMFTMGDRSFQLPGLGSYIQSATDSGRCESAGERHRGGDPDRGGDRSTGVAAADCVERQVQVRAGGVCGPGDVADPGACCSVRRCSTALPGRIWTWCRRADLPAAGADTGMPGGAAAARKRRDRGVGLIGFWTVAAVVTIVAGWAAVQAAMMLRTVSWPDLRLLLEGAGATFLRVNAALLISALWTIPVGVAIGFNPRLARMVQPVAQVLASVPATAFFPVTADGAGADRRRPGDRLDCPDAAGNAVVHPVQRDRGGDVDSVGSARGHFAVTASRAGSAGRRLILPGIFPYLITGMVTASGGAWNASVMAEYSQVKDRTLKRSGWGRRSARPRISGRFPDHSAGHDPDFADGGEHEPAGVAAAVPAGGDAI